MGKNTEKNIKVKREPFEREGKEYFGYFIEGNVRGTDVKIQVKPHDFGGYTVLDIVYNGEMECDLVVKPYEMEDEKTHQVIAGNTFAVQSVGEDGEIYECAVKPSRRSDKNLLDMLIR